MPALHPTSAELLQTAVALLEENNPDDITVDMVLSRSGVSKGSLYHHYRDFDDLLDHAQVQRFGRLVDDSIAMITRVLQSSRTREDCFRGLVNVTEATQADANRSSRSTRIWTLAQAGVRDTMRAALGAEQQRLTDAIADLVREVQMKGWFRPELDARAVAVLIQAYTIGRGVDDVTPEPVDPVAWNRLIDTVIAEVFMGDLGLLDLVAPVS